MTQGDLFRDQGIDRVEENNTWWVENVVDNIIHGIVIRKKEFTSDDVWDEIIDFSKWEAENYNYTLMGLPKDNRAMGAVMRKAQAEGWIEPTDRVVKSTRPVCHSRPIRVWRSKLI